MYKTLYILIFSTLLFSYSDSENLDSTNLRKQDPIRLACVMIDNGLWGYINQDGKFVIKPQFDEAGPFSEGLARVNGECCQQYEKDCEISRHKFLPCDGYTQKALWECAS